jgi:hypothetical protein
MTDPALLASVGRSFVVDQLDSVSPEQLDYLESCLLDYLRGSKTALETSQIFKSAIGTSKPFDRISTILQTPDNPIPDFSALSHGGSAARKKTRSWTDYENQRLLAGIHRYGIEDWQSVAAFVGNGRTRAQCSQRWIRGLDPRISKDGWTPEDDTRLDGLVERYGTKSWTKVANEMGNRSDVQCRYHYKQMKQNDGAALDGTPAGISGSCSFPLSLVLAKCQEKGEKMLLPSIEHLMSQKAFRQSGSLSSLPRLDSAGRK